MTVCDASSDCDCSNEHYALKRWSKADDGALLLLLRLLLMTLKVALVARASFCLFVPALQLQCPVQSALFCTHCRMLKLTQCIDDVHGTAPSRTGAISVNENENCQ